MPSSDEKQSVVEQLVEVYGPEFRDPYWRLNNLYTVVTKEGKQVPFRPNKEQDYYIRNMLSRNIILKARQLGMTTLGCLIYLDDCLFHDNTRATIIAHKKEEATEIFLSKIKAPYEALPEIIKALCPSRRSSQTTLELKNGSVLRTTLSARSGTVQWLHISEYGKMCAQYPEKAREVRTGSFPAAEKGVITIESTAEGEEGDFFDKCQLAQQPLNREPTRDDWRFFFFSWIGRPDYQVPQKVVAESPQDTKYFERLEKELKVTITQPQRNWWLLKESELGGDMKREYPATPLEAFEQSIEGSYFADQIAYLYKYDRIGAFPFDPGFPVNTAWDIGRNDKNTIWLWQDIAQLAVFIGYYEDQGKWIGDYINWLGQWREDHGAVWGKHYLPHDAQRESYWMPQGTVPTMNDMGFFPEIVERSPNKIEAITVARRKMMRCAFDADECKVGLKWLKLYRKEWDHVNGIFKNYPAHNDASHGADGFLTFASSDHMPMPAAIDPNMDRYRRSTRNTQQGRSHMSA